MISARQEIDLRPQLERLDRFVLRSAGVDPAALTFEFRPLWQLSAAEKAGVALVKAQSTAIYAGLNLWPVAVTARLVEAQLVEDGTYPGVAAVLASGNLGTVSEGNAHSTIDRSALRPFTDFSANQPRDPQGRWSVGGGVVGSGGHGTLGENKSGGDNGSPASELSATQLENSPDLDHDRDTHKEAFAGVLIDKRYDEVDGITHCTYGTPVGTFTLEHKGYHSCDSTFPAPKHWS